MTALTHDNISLQFDSGIAFMTVNGPVKKDTLDKTISGSHLSSDSSMGLDSKVNALRGTCSPVWSAAISTARLSLKGASPN